MDWDRIVWTQLLAVILRCLVTKKLNIQMLHFSALNAFLRNLSAKSNAKFVIRLSLVVEEIENGNTEYKTRRKNTI